MSDMTPTRITYNPRDERLRIRALIEEHVADTLEMGESDALNDDRTRWGWECRVAALRELLRDERLRPDR